jgi:hypothetical protein
MRKEAECEVCARLWRQYGEATRNHLTLLRRQQSLESTDAEAAKELDHQVQRAGLRREAARAEIQKHRAADHDEKTMTA